MMSEQWSWLEPWLSPLLTAASAATVIYWRIQHPNQEKTLERKIFYLLLGAQFLWNFLLAIRKGLS